MVKGGHLPNRSYYETVCRRKQFLERSAMAPCQVKISILLLLCTWNSMPIQCTLLNAMRRPRTSPSATGNYHQAQKITHDISLRADATAEPELKSAKAANFPNFLDLRYLQRMPLVILHPSNPIHLELMPDEMNKIQSQVVTPNAVLKFLNSFYGRAPPPTRVPAEKIREEGSEDAQSVHPETSSTDHHPTSGRSSAQASEKKNMKLDFRDHGDNSAVSSARGLMDNESWLNRFKGSFSHLFNHRVPFNPRPPVLAAPNGVHPIFNTLPLFNQFRGNLNPFAASNNRPIFIPLQNPIPLQRFWQQMNHFQPGHFNMDLSPAQTHNFHFLQQRHPMMKPQIIGHPFRGHHGISGHDGGDLMASASQNFHRHVLPPNSLGGPVLSFPKQGTFHSFNKPKQTPVASASSHIINAFKDFEHSDHGPDVTHGFGSMGNSMQSFLNMMGLGVSGITKGFGDFTEAESASDFQLGRSLDFYPGYGNQAMLDDIDDDLDIFQEDITKNYKSLFPETTQATTQPPKTTKMPLKPSQPKPPPQAKATSSPVKESASTLKHPSTSISQKMQNSTPPSMKSKQLKPNSAMETMMDNNAKLLFTGNTKPIHISAANIPHIGNVNAPLRVNINGPSIKKVNGSNSGAVSVSGPHVTTTNIRQNGNADGQHRGTTTNQQKGTTSGRPGNNLNGVHSGSVNHAIEGNLNLPSGKISNGQHNANNPTRQQHQANRPNSQRYFNSPNSQHLSYTNGPYKGIANGPFTGSTNGLTGRVTVVPFSGNANVPKRNNGNLSFLRQWNSQNPTSPQQKNQNNLPKPTKLPNTKTKSSSSQHSNETTYALAISLHPQHQSDSDTSRLVDTDDVRPWIPVSSGMGYVERRPIDKDSTIDDKRKLQVEEIIQKTFAERSKISENKRQ